MALLVKSVKECRRQSANFGLHSLTSPDTTAQHREPNERETYGLDLFIRQTSNLICVTGAGVSTSSGLPDYRGINGSYKRGHKPMVHAEFVNSTSSRQRYWSRSMAGWNRVHLSQPNDSHYALASLEHKQRLKLLVTQNVDGLHEVAGSHIVTDLHGRIDEVICLQCRNISSRVALQRELLAKNPEYVDFLQNFSRNPTTNTNLARADGDVDLGNTYDYSSFCVPDCPLCGGVLKPNVVFFGDNVPVKKVEETYNEVDKADGLLVVGTSLEVFSAYRFVIRADKLGIPIAIINHGETRAERSKLPNIRYKSDANCGSLLKQVALCF